MFADRQIDAEYISELSGDNKKRVKACYKHWWKQYFFGIFLGFLRGSMYGYPWPRQGYQEIRSATSRHAIQVAMTPARHIWMMFWRASSRSPPLQSLGNAFENL